jgi:hypothetical protein
MDSEQVKLKLGADGELEESIDWHGEKVKHSSSLIRRASSHPLFWGFVAQFICMAVVGLTLLGVVGYFSLTHVGSQQQQVVQLAGEVDAEIVSMIPVGSGIVAIAKVDSRKIWQTTKIQIEKNDKVTIQVIEGNWTSTLDKIPYNPGIGIGYTCASAMIASACVEPVPDVPQGQLIGRIGDQLFGVSVSTSLVSNRQGILSLRINDADHGLFDNDGVLTIKITIEK